MPLSLIGNPPAQSVTSAELQLQALAEVGRRASVGGFVHPALWLLMGWSSGLLQQQPVFVWSNLLLFMANQIARMVVGHRIQALSGGDLHASRPALVALLLMTALHWGLLGALSQIFPMFQLAQTPLWMAGVGIAAGGTMAFCILQPVRIWYPLLCVVPPATAAFLLGGRGQYFEAIGSLMFFAYVYHTSGAVQRDYWRASKATAELAERARQLELLSTTDALTHVRNRLYFDHRLVVEWSRAARSGAPLSMLLVDIDHFKRINDSHGHPVGDRCLLAVATALAQVLQRPDDVLARYGGEEFAVLLPATALPGAAEVAEALRASVAAIDMAHEGQSIALACSVGVYTAHPQTADSAMKAMQAADTALYSAKRGGRNRVVVADAQASAAAETPSGMPSDTHV